MQQSYKSSGCCPSDEPEKEITTVGTMTTISDCQAVCATGSFGKRSPITAVKTIVINRSMSGSLSTMMRDSFNSVVSMQRNYGASHLDLHTTAQINSMVTDRETEKNDMRELNERLATYIGKVFFLEAQNCKLTEELQLLRESWGKGTESVKSRFEIELTQLRKLLEDANQYKASMEVRVTTLEDQCNELELLLDEANRLSVIRCETIEKLNQQVAKSEGEISLLLRRAAFYEDERVRHQVEIKRLKQEVARLRCDLNTETLNHVIAEYSAQSLREEIDFQRVLHESELKDLKALVYRDTTTENREYWKNEMDKALHEIHCAYDRNLEEVRRDLESQLEIKLQKVHINYTRDNMQLNHFKEVNERMKIQISNARSRVSELEVCKSELEHELREVSVNMGESLRISEKVKEQLRIELHSCNGTLDVYRRDMQILTDAKLSLEQEISTYRKLLEGQISFNGCFGTTVCGTFIQGKTTSVTEFSRGCFVQGQTGGHSNNSLECDPDSTTAGPAGQVQACTTAPPMYLEKQEVYPPTVSILKSQMTAKTSAQRTSKGKITIQECDIDGKFVTLEFTGKKKEDLSDWTLVRNVDDEKLIVKYTLPKGTVMDSGNKTVKIWAKGQRPAGSKDLEMGEASWGVGSQIVTLLANADGEKASHTQKTKYSTR